MFTARYDLAVSMICELTFLFKALISEERRKVSKKKLTRNKVIFH